MSHAPRVMQWRTPLVAATTASTLGSTTVHALPTLPESSVSVRLSLPVPPSANRYWRYVQGRVLLSREAREYRETVRLSALAQGVREPVPAAIPCTVALRWYRARKSGDLDNRLKQVMDALQGVAYVSDSQITELHAYRDDSDRTRPRVEITVTPETAPIYARQPCRA